MQVFCFAELAGIILGSMVILSIVDSSLKRQHLRYERQVNMQKNLLYAGLILMNSSLGYYFLSEGVIGNYLRYAALAGGFGLIAISIFCVPIRYWAVKLKALIVSAFIGGCFMVLHLMNFGSEIGMRNTVFQVIGYGMFVYGVLLYNPGIKRVPFRPQWYFWPFFVISMLGMGLFLRYIGDVNQWDSSRNLGDNELNPVGVAYTQACLAMVLLGAFLDTKSMSGRTIFAGGILIAVMGVIVTGSRGAAIFGMLAFLGILYLYLRRNFFSVRTISFILVIIPVLGISMVVLSTLSFVQTRFDMLVHRLGGVMPSQDYDNSMVGPYGGRLDIWYEYLYDWEDWFVLGMPNYNPYPHNIFVELFCRFGLLGIVTGGIIAAITLRFLWVGWRNRNSVVSGDLLFVGLYFFCLLQAQSSLSLEINRMLWIGFGYVLMLSLTTKTNRYAQNPQGEDSNASRDLVDYMVQEQSREPWRYEG